MREQKTDGQIDQLYHPSCWQPQIGIFQHIDLI